MWQRLLLKMDGAVDMQIGRLDGFVTLMNDGQLWMTVLLDTGLEVETLRDDAVPAGYSDGDVAELAEELVQESISNELALDGWEVIGVGQTDAEEHALLDVVARSNTWVLKRPM